MKKKKTERLKRRRRILIADDDTAIVDALQIMLEDAGYEVEITIDGKTISNMMQKVPPDVLLLDIWLSGMDGRDICQDLKKNEKTRHIPIIMISANKDTKDIAIECGADDFIAKPFQMEDLLAIISKYAK